ncbi:hypothetical protein KA977_01375, partial [Candidatus Dependentiae bacterium]|nr:hypothetical protein [Candidatus Dependentiae bacterium]
IIQKIKNKSDKINRFQKNNYKSGTIYEVGESYKISIAEFKNDFILDFQIDNNNNFYSVSGKNNSVYKVSGKDYYLIFKNKSGKLQKICFDLSGQPSFIAVSNPSKLYEPNHSEKIFEYISDIIDLGYKASAGTPEIEYSGKIEYTFRTGNTNKINDLWTEWNSSSNSRENRYFQYKIKFLTESSELKKITVPYTQLNLKPIIKSINISSLSNKPKDSKSRQSSRQSSRIQQASHPNMMNEEMVMEAVESFQNQQQVQPNFQMNASNSYNIRWSVSDPNGDKLLHDIFYKYESGDWVKLKFDKHYTKNYYNWNTLYFPDGKYIFKVISTDILDNPSDPLSDEIISEEIILDNTEPDVKIDNSKEKISITASDEYNIIKSCEYSINSSDWKKLYPIDNIFDSKTEKFILNSERLSGSTVTFKISDFNENVKTKGIIIK